MHGSLEDLKVEVDMLTPEGERIVGKTPPSTSSPATSSSARVRCGTTGGRS